MRLVTALIAALAGLAAVAPAAVAQNPFEAVVRVNDSIVTRFEIEQRIDLLDVLGQPGATREEVIDTLIDDRLRLDAARAAGIVPAFDQVELGIDDFAARANLTGAEFLDILGQAGISPETVRDFIRVNIAWGELVRTRFAARARPGDAEIDRALSLGTGQGSARVLLSEIILPLTPELAAQTEEIAARIAEIDTIPEFERAARQFSVAPSRASGGRLDWRPLSDLPPQIAPVLLGLAPGEVAGPLPIQGGIAFFQLRAIEDRRPPLAGDESLDYIRVRFPPGTDLVAELARVRANADVCGDLWGVYQGAAPGRIQRQTEERADLPPAVAQRMLLLDPGEAAVIGPQATGDGGSLLMLCARVEIRDEEISRGQVAEDLFRNRLNSFAEGFLAELEAAAFIERL